MNYKFLLSLITTFFLLGCISYGQLPPGINPSADHWVLNEGKSDEFNGFFLDTTKWWSDDPCARHGYDSPGSFNRPQNVSLDSGYLILKIEVNPDSADWNNPCVHYNNYPYWGGSILSIMYPLGTDIGAGNNYSFGYYEISAQLPGYYDTNYNPVGFGFYPTFWIFYQHTDSSCILKHDEVDIFESDPNQYYDARSNYPSWHDENFACGQIRYGADSLRSPTPMFDSFHKYGVELLPDKIVFYFDDQPYFSADTITSPSIVHSLNMAPYLTVEIDGGTGGAHGTPGPLPTAPFPEYMYVDYFRYYQLDTNQNTGNSLSQNSPNPVNSSADIQYSIDNNATNAYITIYSITGAEIKSAQLNSKGNSNVTIDTSDLFPGVYFYRLVVDDKVIGTKKMVVIR